MHSFPSLQPDIRQQLKERLLTLSPRAFELFAGDLLVYIGLQHITVTRSSGDGGIDAYGNLISTSGLVTVSTGVQVKRHRRNIQRIDIDRFIGALAGQYQHGLFITTAGYAQQARLKASTSPVLRIDTIDGNQIVELMHQHQLGLTINSRINLIDEDYFLGFETETNCRAALREESTVYTPDQTPESVVLPEDDLISLRALSYLLRIDTTTIRHWIERNKIVPARNAPPGQREGIFFRRDTVERIRQQLVGLERPQTAAEWRHEFLTFAKSKNMTKSYKPVLLKAMIKLVNRDGEVDIDQLTTEFQAFYIERQRAGLPVEFGVPLLQNPVAASHQAIKRLLIQHPLERFIIKGFLEYDTSSGMVRFAPHLWHDLRVYELLDVQTSADEQLSYYYRRSDKIG